MIDLDARDALAAVAVFATGGAVAVLAGGPVGSVSAVRASQLAVVVGLAAVVTAGWLLRDRLVLPSRRRGPRVGGDPRGPWDDPLVRPEPERVELGAERPLGAAITVAAEDDDLLTAEHGPGKRIARVRAQRRLRDAVERELVAVEGSSEREAAKRVEQGTWTDDDRAAAFLAEGPPPSLPPLVRLRDWLAGKRTARGVHAAVRELERLAERDRSSVGHDESGRQARRTTTGEWSNAPEASGEGDAEGSDGDEQATEPPERERVYPKPRSEVSR